jgi:hypothetical protein
LFRLPSGIRLVGLSGADIYRAAKALRNGSQMMQADVRSA